VNVHDPAPGGADVPDSDAAPTPDRNGPRRVTASGRAHRTAQARSTSPARSSGQTPAAAHDPAAAHGAGAPGLVVVGSAPGVPPASGSSLASALVDRLAFLHELAQLATHARDWDELMRTVVDRTTLAMGVEVCSFYLLDRDGRTLTLAATNGLDPDKVGAVSLELGRGITGRAAESRTPVSSSDVTADERFSWVRGLDVQGLRGMLSMPLVWDEQVVGVLNVQTTAVREFAPEEIEFLATIAALLAGIVEKGRMQAEAEAQLDRLSQLDAARAELLAVVTHELRTPLAVVRAYVDLLADTANAGATVAEVGPSVDVIENWRAGAIDQVTRLDRLVDSILASVRGEGLTGLRREPFNVVDAVDKTVGTLALLLRTRAVRWNPPGFAMVARGDEVRFRQVLEQLLDNEAKYAPPELAVSLGAWRTADEIQVYITDDGPGVPIEDWEAVFQPYVRVDRARSRGSGIGLFAARRLMEAMGGRVWIEKNGYGGSRFMVALPIV
jgi:signal transduction histidine kinase